MTTAERALAFAVDWQSAPTPMPAQQAREFACRAFALWQDAAADETCLPSIHEELANTTQKAIAFALLRTYEEHRGGSIETVADIEQIFAAFLAGLAVEST